MLANTGTEFDEKSNNNYPLWNIGFARKRKQLKFLPFLEGIIQPLT
jgi:hypothetical protein